MAMQPLNGDATFECRGNLKTISLIFDATNEMNFFACAGLSQICKGMKINTGLNDRWTDSAEREAERPRARECYKYRMQVIFQS